MSISASLTFMHRRRPSVAHCSTSDSARWPSLAHPTFDDTSRRSVVFRPGDAEWRLNAVAVVPSERCDDEKAVHAWLCPRRPLDSQSAKHGTVASPCSVVAEGL